jgi:hypothetical protein
VKATGHRSNAFLGLLLNVIGGYLPRNTDHFTASFDSQPVQRPDRAFREQTLSLSKNLPKFEIDHHLHPL